MTFPKSKPPISTPLQDLCIRELYPNFRSVGKAIWIGHLQPRENSPIYKVKIDFRQSLPKVWVIYPTLVDNPPHIFSDRSLCLYYFKDQSWTSQKFIGKTIIPWTAEWLFAYELWLATGQWCRPEVPHEGQKFEI